MAGGRGRLVIFSWNTEPELVEASLAGGAAGYIAKGVPAKQLVDLIEAVHRGERVVPDTMQSPESDDFGRWPGSEGYGETPKAQWGLLGVDNGEQPLTSVPTEAGGYPDFYAQVAASIRDGAPVPVDARHALETVRIIEQAHALNPR